MICDKLNPKRGNNNSSDNGNYRVESCDMAIIILHEALQN